MDEDKAATLSQVLATLQAIERRCEETANELTAVAQEVARIDSDVKEFKGELCDPIPTEDGKSLKTLVVEALGREKKVMSLFRACRTLIYAIGGLAMFWVFLRGGIANALSDLSDLARWIAGRRP